MDSPKVDLPIGVMSVQPYQMNRSPVLRNTSSSFFPHQLIILVDEILLN